MTPSLNKGFTLLETLIAFVVLTVGLLGAVALQAQAKQASYDSLQRAAAINLANDILGRIAVNDTVTAMGIYNTNISSLDSAYSSNLAACFDVPCASDVLANFDIEQWKMAIKAREGTGTLSDATICINPVVDNNKVELQVIITWQGRQQITQNAVNSGTLCGSTDNNRKMVSVNRFIYMRPA